MARAEYIVNYFGGVSHFAKISGISRTTLYTWMEMGNTWQGIPRRFRRRIMDYAAQNSIDFLEEDLVSHKRLQDIIEDAERTTRYRSNCGVCITPCDNPVPHCKVPWFDKE